MAVGEVRLEGVGEPVGILLLQRQHLVERQADAVAGHHVHVAGQQVGLQRGGVADGADDDAVEERPGAGQCGLRSSTSWLPASIAGDAVRAVVQPGIGRVAVVQAALHVGAGLGARRRTPAPPDGRAAARPVGRTRRFGSLRCITAVSGSGTSTAVTRSQVLVLVKPLFGSRPTRAVKARSAAPSGAPSPQVSPGWKCSVTRMPAALERSAAIRQAGQLGAEQAAQMAVRDPTPSPGGRRSPGCRT